MTKSAPGGLECFTAELTLLSAGVKESGVYRRPGMRAGAGEEAFQGGRALQQRCGGGGRTRGAP